MPVLVELSSREITRSIVGSVQDKKTEGPDSFQELTIRTSFYFKFILLWGVTVVHPVFHTLNDGTNPYFVSNDRVGCTVYINCW